MKKASNNAINNVYVTLQGFLTNEAPNIGTLGDPSVQLPLNTARADSNRLKDEIAVLKRNPGLESSLTEEDLYGIQANLAYLQKKWRLSANNITEGFDCGCTKWGGAYVEGFTDSEVAVAEEVAPAEEVLPAEEVAPTEQATPVTLNDLKDATAKIGVEITRLGMSGSTDDIVNGRINTLKKMQSTIDDMIGEVEKGFKDIKDVNISKADLDAFLPIMSNLNSPLPQIVQQTEVNPIIQNLFQKYAGGDAEGAKDAQKMFDKYAEHILKNLSLSVNIKYTSDGEQQASMNNLNAIMNTLNAATFESSAPESSYPGYFNSVIQNMGETLPGEQLPINGGSRVQGSRGQGSRVQDPQAPASFQWKERASQICDQINARGLKPSDFGCIKNQGAVSEGYSWRGNVKLVCNRLQTVFDPSVREACGCPPLSWPGWKS